MTLQDTKIKVFHLGQFLEVMILKDFFLFNGLTDAEISALEKGLPDPVVFEKGGIIKSGCGGDCIGILTEGTAKCFVKNSDVVMRMFRGGDIFGVTGLFEDNDVSTIMAVSRCSVVFMKRDAFQELLKSSPALSMNYIRFLTGRICFLNRKIGLYSLDNAEHKVYTYLTSLADENGCVSLGNMTLTARTLGIGRSSLYRALESLEEKNIISKNGKIYCLKELSL